MIMMEKQLLINLEFIICNFKSIFPYDDSLHKYLYLATMDISDKWTQKIRNLNQILAHLSIYFDDKISSLNYEHHHLQYIFYQYKRNSEGLCYRQGLLCLFLSRETLSLYNRGYILSEFIKITY